MLFFAFTLEALLFFADTLAFFTIQTLKMRISCSFHFALMLELTCLPQVNHSGSRLLSPSIEREADVMFEQPIPLFAISTNRRQRCQAGRTIRTPAHAVMLLSMRNHDIIGFLDGIARDAQTELLS